MRNIIDTRHSIERFFDENRFDTNQRKILRTKIEWVIKNAMKQIIDKHKDESQVYGIHSKSTGIGILIHWRKDYKSRDGLNHAIIMTILPMKNNHKFRDAQTLLVEQITSIIPKKKLKESSIEGTSSILTIGSWDIILYEGKYYDDTAVKVIVE